MLTPPLSDKPTGLRTYSQTSNSASGKRKAEDSLPSPSQRRQRLKKQLTFMSPAVTPTHLSSPMRNCEPTPQGNDAAFSSRIQRAIDLSFCKSESSTVFHSKNGPIKENRAMAAIPRTIDLTFDFNSSRHISLTRFLTESDSCEADDTRDQIQKVTAEISETVEARRWLYVIGHQLHKILHELAQIETAAVEATRATKSMLLFSNNIYHLKEEIKFFNMCQQHKMEESYGEQALLGFKLTGLQESSQLQVDGTSKGYSQSVSRSPEETNLAICRALFKG